MNTIATTPAPVPSVWERRHLFSPDYLAVLTKVDTGGAWLAGRVPVHRLRQARARHGDPGGQLTPWKEVMTMGAKRKFYREAAKAAKQDRQQQADATRAALPWYRQRTVGQAITTGLRDRAAHQQN